MSRTTWWLPVLAALALGACATRPVRAPLASLPPEALARAEQAQAARERALAGAAAWTMQGRVAISRGDKGGSGRIDWQQDGDAYRLALSAPVTRQSWRLVGDAAQARIEGLEGGTREGPDASRLLLDATGLEIPVAALASWARGARADPARFGVATLGYDAQGGLVHLVQGGWRIDYIVWQPAAGALPRLPLRLEAERGDAKVRLIVDTWGGPEGP